MEVATRRSGLGRRKAGEGLSHQAAKSHVSAKFKLILRCFGRFRRFWLALAKGILSGFFFLYCWGEL
jgi:hypothetical protein